MLGEKIKAARPAPKFWLLAAFLALVFLTGGSSRADVQSLQILRPIAILVGAYALFTMTLEQWRRYRHLAFILAAVIALVGGHLIPLPPEKWQALPGHSIIRDIDLFLNIQGNWRPLSMVPAGTWNALYALSVPVAVFGLAVQLASRDQVRLLMLLIALSIISGALGFLQAIGGGVRLFALSSETAGLFANRNHQGVLLAMTFSMLAVAAVWGEVVLQRRLVMILAAALAIIAVPLIVITGSRAGLIAMVIAIVLVPIVGTGRASSKRRGGWLLSTGKYVVAVAVIGVMLWLTVFASREMALTRLQGGSEGDVRYPVWASIIDVLPRYLPWGSGVGSYADVYQILEPDALLRPTFSNHAHNEWLEIALTAGLPGIGMIVWAVMLFLYAAVQAHRSPALEGTFGRLGLSLLAILAFASTFDYPVRTPIMASVFVIAAVWASSFKRFGSDDGPV